jgi:hypothetical protein
LGITTLLQIYIIITYTHKNKAKGSGTSRKTYNYWRMTNRGKDAMGHNALQKWFRDFKKG